MRILLLISMLTMYCFGSVIVHQPESIKGEYVSQYAAFGNEKLLGKPPVTGLLIPFLLDSECKINETVIIPLGSIGFEIESEAVEKCGSYLKATNPYSSHPNISALILGVDRLLGSIGFGPKIGEIDSVTMFIAHMSVIDYKVLLSEKDVLITVDSDLGPFYDFIHTPLYMSYRVTIPILDALECLFCIYVLYKFILSKKSPSLTTQSVICCFLYCIGIMVRIAGGEGTLTFFRTSKENYASALWACTLWVSLALGTTAYALTVLVWIRVLKFMNKGRITTIFEYVFLVYFYALPVVVFIIVFLKGFLKFGAFYLVLVALITLGGGLVCIGTIVFGCRTLYVLHITKKSLHLKSVNLRMTLFILISSVLWAFVVITSIGFNSAGSKAYTNPYPVFPWLVLRDVIGLLLSFMITVIFVTSSSTSTSYRSKDVESSGQMSVIN